MPPLPPKRKQVLLSSVLALQLAVPALHAAGPAWVGTWKLDRPASHFVGFVVTITRLPHRYRFELEGATIQVGDDGKDYPTVPTRTTSFQQLNDHQWFRVHKINGKEVDHSTFTLAPDARSFVIHTSVLDDAGQAHQTDEIFKRESSGTDIAGTWRSTSAGINATETFTVTAAGSGRLRFNYPREDLSYVSSLDGSPIAYTGAHAISSLTITVRAVSPTQLLWTNTLHGSAYLQGTDVLSSDRQVLTGTSWHVAHPNEKDEAVYRRQ